MMKKIFKYPLKIADSISIEMPINAKILYVHEQDNRPCIWALVNPEADTEKRNFRIAGTGHEIKEEGLVYIGSVSLYTSTLIFHIFEDKGWDEDHAIGLVIESLENESTFIKCPICGTEYHKYLVCPKCY